MTKRQKLGAKLLAALSPIIILMFVGTGLLYGLEFVSDALFCMFLEIAIFLLFTRIIWGGI